MLQTTRAVANQWLKRGGLPDLEPLIFSMWLVTHREVNTSRRVRVVYDHHHHRCNPGSRGRSPGTPKEKHLQ